MPTEYDHREGPGPWPDTGALDLEDLLDELRGRAQAARQSHERMAALLDAVVAVSADLELSEVLGRIVRSACALVDARYGALGVLGPDGEHLMEFVTHGVTDEEREAIGDLPRGHGVLGLLIREPESRRMRDIGKHPDSYGFPPNHPPMHSFLGTPIRIRDEVFGNLYMAEKKSADEFTADDESMLVALAAAAGVAIENARLYDRSQQQQRWATAIGELTQTLLEAEEEDLALDLMAQQAVRLTGAALAGVALYDEAGDLVVRSLQGAPPGSVLSGPHWDKVVQTRQPLLLLASPGQQSVQQPAAEVRALGGLSQAGPTALLPIAPGHGDMGILLLAWTGDQEAAASEVMPPLTDFAQQAGLALIAARSQRDRSRVALLEDRDRIARDMHDNVIQRLFATGLSLQSATRLAQHPMVRERLDDAVEDLDAAIKDIRHAIFELHRVAPAGGARGELEELIDTYADSLGFVPDLVIEGRLGGLPEAVQADAIAVVREGLSNIAQHAGASRASVAISVADGLEITVSDDGIGMSPASARSGLVNLGTRAAARSGVFEIEPGDSGGTVLRWRVP